MDSYFFYNKKIVTNDVFMRLYKSRTVLEVFKRVRNKAEGYNQPVFTDLKFTTYVNITQLSKVICTLLTV